MSHSQCFNASVEAPLDTSTWTFWVEGVALTTTATFGIAGNTLTVLVLAKISLGNVFNQLIVTLCLMDSIFDLISVIEFGLRKAFALIAYSSPVYVDLWPTLIFPVQNITYSASLAITLAIAIERYLAICHPFLVHGDHSVVASSGEVRQLRKRTLCYLTPALLFAVVVNIPKFFEFTTYQSAEGVTSIRPTSLRLDETYQLVYLHWVRTIVTAALPFVLLAFLNGSIIYHMRRAEMVAALRTSGCASSSASRKETKLARVLVLLVFSFLFCNVGKLLLNLYDLGNLHLLRECAHRGLAFRSPFWVSALISFNHWLLVTNASTNLLFFALMGTQFRSTLTRMLRGGNDHRNSSPIMLSVTTARHAISRVGSNRPSMATTHF